MQRATPSEQYNAQEESLHRLELLFIDLDHHVQLYLVRRTQQAQLSLIPQGLPWKAGLALDTPSPLLAFSAFHSCPAVPDRSPPFELPGCCVSLDAKVAEAHAVGTFGHSVHRKL